MTDQFDFTVEVTAVSLHRDRTAEPALVERLKLGEEEAWAHFVTDYSVRLHDYLKARLPTTEDAQDVLSDTLLGVVQAIRAFDHKIPLLTFVYQIVHRKIIEYWQRRASGIQPFSLPGVVPSQEVSVRYDPVLRLPKELQRILLLRYYVGYSIDEIATLLGKSSQETETLLQQARRQLQASWEKPTKHTFTEGRVYTLFQSVVPMLQTQYGKCSTQNMVEEARLFQRAIRHLQRLLSEYTMSELP